MRQKLQKLKRQKMSCFLHNYLKILSICCFLKEDFWIVRTISSVKTKYLRNFFAAQTNTSLTFLNSFFFVWYVWILKELEHSFLHDLGDSSDSSTRLQWIELPDICSIQWNGFGTRSQAAEKSSNFRIFYYMKAAFVTCKRISEVCFYNVILVPLF